MFFPCFSEGFGHGMDIELCGKPFWLHGIRGTVHSVRQWSEDITYRPPASSMKVGDTLFVDIPAEKTFSTRHYQKFWVVASDGRQFQVDVPCQVREGQQVCLVWGNVKGEKVGRMLYIRNLSLGHSSIVHNTLPWSVLFASVGRMTARALMVLLVFALILKGADIFRNLVGHYTRQGTNPLWLVATWVMVAVILFGALFVVIGFLRVLWRLFENKRQAIQTLSDTINSNPRFLESL
ncbi:hypothetical protein [Gluconobacter cerinus]|uniref:hypothetical protein n=1 Tax=Gluconobacter cerinus TaxID=38307 RepID=UPI001C03FDC9|nr:hypothetical protein [Gluconobacter cerinus]